MGPYLRGLIVLAVGDRNLREARWTALLGAVIGFLATIRSSPVSRRDERHAVRRAHALDSPLQRNYHLGVDGISVLFILLNSFITVLVVIAGWEAIREKVAHTMRRFWSCRAF